MKIRTSLIKLLYIVVLIFLTMNLFAKNYYANPASTSSVADGSLANPWKTIDQVNAGTTVLLPGDSVLFRRGQKFSGRLYGRVSGTAGKNIVYAGYGVGDLPEFTHTTTTVIGISLLQFITIDGIRIIDRTMDPNDHNITAKIAYGIELDRSPYITIKNCDISLVGVGLDAGDGSNYLLITGNYFHNLRMVRNTVGGSDDYGANGIVLGSYSNMISNNKFEDLYATSYDFGQDGGAVEFYNTNMNENKVIYNTAIKCSGFLEMGSANAAFAINTLVAYNKIINCGPIGVFHNVALNEVKVFNTQYFNNVIINTDRVFVPVGNLFWMGDRTQIDVINFRNNIVWLTSGFSMANNNLDTAKLVHKNNIYHIIDGTLGIRLDPTELRDGLVGLFMDTTAANPANWDYHLKPGSVAINFGVDVGLPRDFEGTLIADNLPDAGVYEYVATSPTAPLIAAVKPGTIKCFGDSTLITVLAVGGSTPYTGTGVFKVPAGNYKYIVTDSKGAKDSVFTSIVQPAKLDLSVLVGAFIPGGVAITTLTSSGIGGTLPYTYNLNSGAYQSSGLFSNIFPGTYTMAVKDSNACVFSKSVQVVNIPLTPPIASIEAIPIKCNGDNTTITVSATSGTAPYTGTGNFSVGAGTYTYIVTDSKGLKDTVSITLTQPSIVDLSVVVSPFATGATVTTITSSGSGGKLPYLYNINTGVYQSSGVFNNVTPGTYNLSVKDSNACVLTKSVDVINTPILLPPIASIESIPIKCNGGITTVTVSATSGTPPYSGTGTFNVGAGTYSYVVTDSKGLKDTVSVTLTQPTAMSLLLAAGVVPSSIDSTRITATASGGVSPFTYKLDNGVYQTGNIFYNVYPGNYEVTAKDVNNCTVTKSVAIIVTAVTTVPNNKLKISVYPNPTYTYFTLGTIKYKGSSFPIKIRVYNAYGLLVYNMQGNSNVTYSFGSGFLSGYYTIIVEVDNTVQALQLIKL